MGCDVTAPYFLIAFSLILSKTGKQATMSDLVKDRQTGNLLWQLADLVFCHLTSLLQVL